MLLAVNLFRQLVGLLLLFAMLAPFAEAVVIRGVVSDPLGRPVPGARILLIEQFSHGHRGIGMDVAGADGSFEIRSSASGRFVLLITSGGFSPQIGQSFYGGRTAVRTQTISLDRTSIQDTTTHMASALPTPLEQLSSRVSTLPPDDLCTRTGVDDDLGLAPGLVLIQTGQAGGFAALWTRGGDSSKVTIDGVAAEDPGGRFDFSAVSGTALSGVEVYRGANSALDGADAEAGAVSLATQRGDELRPAFDYTGDAGNLHTWRDEAAISGARSRLDYLAAYTRFDTSNALPLDRYHLSATAANLGLSLSANTQARFTLRNTDAASGLPGPHDLFGVSADGRRADQDLYSGLTVENRTGGSHTVVRYGIARKREEMFEYIPVGQPGNGAYLGDIVDLHGANGSQAIGRVEVSYAGSYPAQEDDARNRDESSMQSDYEFNRHFSALGTFRYENERGRFAHLPNAQDIPLYRTNFDYNIQLQGDIVNRVFYSAGGAIEKNHLLGLEGNPRVGIAYVPVRPGSRWMRGTKVYGTIATGFDEPSLRDTADSLYTTLTQAGNGAAIEQYHLGPMTAQRSRSFEIGVDQNIRGQKLIFRSNYFHNQFSHQIDVLDPGALKLLFGIPARPLAPDAADDSLAYRAQGIETEIHYQALPQLLVHGAYTYLSSMVERTFAGGALTNPSYPGVAIGPSYPLLGARPFQRPPHSGFFAAQYTGTRLTAAIEGTMSSRSDDSTFQAGNDQSGGNSFLLPNRDLDFGYIKLDTDFTWKISRHITVFAQLDNLLNQQHIGPIGYPGLPFTVRSGLKIHLSGE